MGNYTPTNATQLPHNSIKMMNKQLPPFKLQSENIIQVRRMKFS